MRKDHFCVAIDNKSWSYTISMFANLPIKQNTTSAIPPSSFALFHYIAHINTKVPTGFLLSFKVTIKISSI